MPRSPTTGAPSPESPRPGGPSTSAPSGSGPGRRSSPRTSAGSWGSCSPPSTTPTPRVGVIEPDMSPGWAPCGPLAAAGSAPPWWRGRWPPFGSRVAPRRNSTSTPIRRPAPVGCTSDSDSPSPPANGCTAGDCRRGGMTSAVDARPRPADVRSDRRARGGHARLEQMRYRPLTPALLVRELAVHVDRRPETRPRVGFDGFAEAGVADLADAVAEQLREFGRPVIRASTRWWWRAASLRLELGRTDSDMLLYGWVDGPAL